VNLARYRRYTSTHITPMTTPSSLYGCAGSIAAHQVIFARLGTQHEGILVIWGRAAITRYLPGSRASSSHHVHAVIQLVHGRVLAADIVLPVSVQNTFPHSHPSSSVSPGYFPLAGILGITATLVKILALAVGLSHEGTATADSIGHLASHHSHIVTIGVAVLG